MTSESDVDMDKGDTDLVPDPILKKIYLDAMAVANDGEKIRLKLHEPILLDSYAEDEAHLRVKDLPPGCLSTFKLTAWASRPDADVLAPYIIELEDLQEWTNLDAVETWEAKTMSTAAKLLTEGKKPLDAIYFLEQLVLEAKANILDFPMECNVSMLLDESHPWYPIAISWIGGQEDSPLCFKGIPISQETQTLVRALPREIRKKLRNAFDETACLTKSDGDIAIRNCLGLLDINKPQVVQPPPVAYLPSALPKSEWEAARCEVEKCVSMERYTIVKPDI